MADVIGRTVIEVGADASGFSKELSSQTDAAATSAGKSFNSKFGGLLTTGAKAAAVGAGAIVAASFAKGFGRLTAIEDAEAKLTGLGHSAKAVEKIMLNATDAVTGTAFGLGEAASQSATLVAAGIKPGKELEATLAVMADTATIAGSSLDEMGSVFGKIAAGGKLTGESLAQLQDRGIPVLQLLADETGKSEEAVRKMVSAGKVDFKTFQSAMDKGLGGSALEAGKTVSGAMANVGAALGRVGAAFLQPAFDQLPAVLSTLTDIMGDLTPVAEQVGSIVGGILATAFEAALGLAGLLVEGIKPLIGIFQTIWTAVSDLGSAILDTLTPAFEAISGALEPVVAKFVEVKDIIAENEATAKILGGVLLVTLIPAFVAAATMATQWAIATAVAFAKAATQALLFGPQILILLTKLGWAYLKNAARAVAAAAVKAGVWVGEAAKATAAGVKMAIVFAAQKARWVASGVAALAGAAVNAGAWLLMSASAIASGIASGIAFVAQKVGWVTSAATAMASAVVIAAAWLIALGPIGLIIAAIALVIAIFVGLWLKFEGFRNFWIGLWEMILEVFGAVWDAIKKAFELALSFIMAYIKAWIAVFLAVWDGIKKVWTFVKGIFDKIKAVIKTVVDWITEKVTQFIVGIIRTWMRIKELWNRARFIFEKIKKMIAIWVLRIKQKIKDFVQGIVDKVVGIKDKLIEGGKNLIKGLWDGIKSMGSWIKDKVLGFLKNMIPGPLKGFLGLDDEGGGDDVSASSNTGGGTVKSLSIPGQRAYGGSTTTDQSVSAKIYVTTPAADPKIVAEQVFDRAAQLARV